MVVKSKSVLFTWVLAIFLMAGLVLLLVGGTSASWEAELDDRPGGRVALDRGPTFLSMEDLRYEGPFDDCPDCTRGALFPLVHKIYPELRMAVGASLPDSDMAGFESMTGKHHGMYKLYMPWWHPGFGVWISFSSGCPICVRVWADRIVENGSVPMITWMSSHCDLDQINNGSHDYYITQFATEVRDWGHRILISWGDEMNVQGVYTWSGSDTNKFKAAYRRIRNIFKSVGADNAEFVWSPSYMTHPPEWPGYNEYYPGDDYVDWVGVNGYNWGVNDYRNPFRTWATFDMIFGPVLADFSSRYPAKRQMISETACAPDDGGSKAQWITDAYGSMKNNHWPRLRAVFWFQHNKEKDWRVQSWPGDTLQAYRDAVNGEFFDGPYPEEIY